MDIVVLKNLKKSYGKKTAVNGINLNIKEGQIYGILGPNGAGKSTTINMICGLLTPTEGEIYVLNEKMNKKAGQIKNNIGVVPQDIAIYEDLSAYDNVKFFGQLYGIKGKYLKKSVVEALEFVGLKESAKQLPSRFSGGMKRRLNIACAIVHKPKVIIMDEPTVGIDPQSRNHILESIKKLNSNGSTIIYTSHYMEEVEAICSDVAIIDNGKVIAQGEMEKLIMENSDKNTILISIKQDVYLQDIEALKKIQGVENIELKDKTIFVYNKVNVDNLDKIISFLMEKKILIKNIESKHNDLESIFLNLTGKKLRD